MDHLKELIDSGIKDINMHVDDIFYKDHVLNVVLDSSEVIDVERIVLATKIINPIVDKEDIIKDSYTLDVYSKESK